MDVCEYLLFFFSSRRRHTRCSRDWSSDVCSSDLETGFRSGDGTTRAGSSRDLPQEALMLTGDENIVDINFTVFWIIKEPQAYLFNIRNPEGTVKAAAESAMREVVGETPIAQALAEGRGKIE